MALLRLLPILLLFACAKETPTNVYDILQNSEHAEVRALTVPEVQNLLSSLPPTYNSSDLLQFLSEFNSVDPDLIPTWNNWFQDANCSTAEWTYTSEGTPTWIIYDDTLNVQDLIFQTWTPSGMPNCTGYIPPCNGAHECRVEVDYQGARFAREAIGWALVNNAPIPVCSLSVTSAEPSGLFWEGEPLEFEPYQFMIESSLTWDLDEDHDVDIDDLYLLLAQYE